MASQKEERKWEDGVYQFETSDSVQGGPDGVDNVPTKQLANRTRHLKDRVDAADRAIAGLVACAAAGSPATGDALDLRADLFGRAEERVGELAKIADERGIAGIERKRVRVAQQRLLR
ncbi:DUF2514 family protein [Burkholderia diffusa]|uniref:DUF2514 family protein n=1 Tax=Burkholderia diffusa TaxID=488732 RepID=UPI001FD193F4|nr:DUF2514 family protein [Burkholderia diffusa]